MAQYIGDDGKEYNTFREMVGADKMYQNKLEQTELLKEQKQLTKEQNEIIKREAEHNRMLEEEKILSNELIAARKIEHDKEMRILGLFDKISLNKKYYDEFENYLFANNELEIIDKNKDNQKQIKKLEEDVELINKYLKNEIDFDKVSKFAYGDYDKYKTQNNKNILEDFLKNHNITNKNTIIDILNLKENDKFMKLNNYINEHSKIGIKYAKIAAASLLVGLLFSNNEFIGYCAIALMLISCFIALYHLLTGNYKKLYSIMDPLIKDKIKELDNDINNYNNDEYINNKLKEYIMKSKDNIKTIESDINNNLNNLNELNNKWNEFVDFRKKHYNIDLESLFIDTGLEDKITNLGLEYNRLNSNNKIKDGSVEDYIVYFNNKK